MIYYTYNADELFMYSYLNNVETLYVYSNFEKNKKKKSSLISFLFPLIIVVFAADPSFVD